MTFKQSSRQLATLLLLTCSFRFHYTVLVSLFPRWRRPFFLLNSDLCHCSAEMLQAPLLFPYQGLLVLQRPRLHPFLRRRGCGGRHLRAQSSGLPLRLGLRPGLGSRPPAPARVPVLSPQPRQPSAESLRLASRPPRAGRGRSSPRCSARRPGSALGPPPRLQRGGRGRLKLWSSRHLGRGRGLRRGRVCWRVEGPSRVCGSLRRDVRGLGLAGLRAF